ncbi:hypothetical protein DL762_009260 [Monosporascus cannonballus]|uniref:WH1 domain-containing protein n=1 Tax=Monosporascus cannonballus TaxID=155416 RepID=A0ABY0GTU8_9PEZI|nr:hypothetical protein DL762_009260 [Monosporascus cannonballus]
MSILSDEDKETVKRVVPKHTNKIQAVAVARLYVAYPNRSRWTYTGLQGAIVLANDLVGNTYWLKMVDVSPAGRGVIWDQEIFDTWSYNQDRTFFHTFELEDCLAGLSFVDEKEAKQFKKKMDEREKNASKATKNTPFGGPAQHSAGHRGFFGGIFGGHRHSSAPSPTPPDSPRASLPPQHFHARMSSGNLSGLHNPPSEFAELEAYDPNWRQNFGNFLTEQGLTDEFIRENQGFIIDFLKQQGSAIDTPPPPPPPPASIEKPQIHATGHGRAPPPPPPSARGSESVLSSGSRRGVPPPPPAPRRSKVELVHREPTPPQEPTPPPPPGPRFRAPPAIPDAGKYAHEEPPSRSAHATPAPPPPPRPPKTPVEDKEESAGHRPGATAAPPGTRSTRSTTASSDVTTQGTDLASSAATPSFYTACPSTAEGLGASATTDERTGTTSIAIDKRAGTAPITADKRARATTATTNKCARATSITTDECARAAAVTPDRCARTPSTAARANSEGWSGCSAATAPSTSTSGWCRRATTAAPTSASGWCGRATTTPAAPAASESRLGLRIWRAGPAACRHRSSRSAGRYPEGGCGAAVGGSDTGPHGSGLPPAGVTPGGGGGMADALAAALQKRKAKVRDSDDEKSDDDW